MGLSAKVQSVQALIDLKTSINYFGNEAQASLQCAEQEILSTEEWLRQRLAHWKMEEHRRQNALLAAEKALASCKASGYRDEDGYYHAPDCTSYEFAVSQAVTQLQEAQAEINNIKQWTSKVNQATASYRAQAHRLSRIISSDIPNASAFLGKKITELQSYLGAKSGLRSSQSEETHGYPYQKARKAFMVTSLSDPNVGKNIKGWIKQELNRVGKSGYLRSPPGYDVGHKIPGIDLPDNFQWEHSNSNRSKGAKHKI